MLTYSQGAVVWGLECLFNDRFGYLDELIERRVARRGNGNDSANESVDTPVSGRDQKRERNTLERAFGCPFDLFQDMADQAICIEGRENVDVDH